MSTPIDPTRPDLATDPSGATHEIRRRGRLFGFAYSFGIRISELPDAPPGPSRPPLLSAPQRLALPGTPESAEPPASEGIGRQGSEGGK